MNGSQKNQEWPKTNYSKKARILRWPPKNTKSDYYPQCIMRNIKKNILEKKNSYLFPNWGFYAVEAKIRGRAIDHIMRPADLKISKNPL